MAGKPISRAYAALIEKVGISTILDKVANGETMGSIASGIGVSRWFLSTYLNRDTYVADALNLCRAHAAHKRLAAHPKEMGGREARQWVADAPAMHLAALKTIRIQDSGETARKPDVGAERAAALKPQHGTNSSALLRKDGLPAGTFNRGRAGVCTPTSAMPTDASGPADAEQLTQ